jgi:hypothetical protein
MDLDPCKLGDRDLGRFASASAPCKSQCSHTIFNAPRLLGQAPRASGGSEVWLVLAGNSGLSAATSQ